MKGNANAWDVRKGCLASEPRGGTQWCCKAVAAIEEEVEAAIRRGGVQMEVVSKGLAAG